jgi:hypothetical protein
MDVILVTSLIVVVLSVLGVIVLVTAAFLCMGSEQTQNATGNAKTNQHLIHPADVAKLPPVRAPKIVIVPANASSMQRSQPMTESPKSVPSDWFKQDDNSGPTFSEIIRSNSRSPARKS